MKYDVSKSSGMLRIYSIAFFGSYAESTNGAYTVSWNDKRTVVVSPNGDVRIHEFGLTFGDAIISDNGRFLLAIYNPKNRSTRLKLHDVDGTLLFDRKMTKEGFQWTLSPNADYVACLIPQAGAYGQVWVISTATNQVTAKIDRRCEPIRLEFDIERSAIYFHVAKLGRFAFSFSGAFLDQQAFINAGGTPYGSA